ncbi:MAG TPA: DinB family protein [Candidatus Limnocylindria bacterium]|jgi:hypothetical protein
MSERSETALASLRAQAAELERVVRTLSDADWRRICANERWPAGFVALHIARGFQRQSEWVEDARSGRAPHRFDWAETHALNAAIAAAHPAPGRDDVLALSAASVALIEQAVRAMTDEALARVAWLYEGTERDVVWIVGSLAVRHARGHLESIAAAVA